MKYKGWRLCLRKDCIATTLMNLYPCFYLKHDFPSLHVTSARHSRELLNWILGDTFVWASWTLNEADINSLLIAPLIFKQINIVFYCLSFRFVLCAHCLLVLWLCYGDLQWLKIFMSLDNSRGWVFLVSSRSHFPFYEHERRRHWT